jgi:hypothetical protein
LVAALGEQHHGGMSNAALGSDGVELVPAVFGGADDLEIMAGQGFMEHEAWDRDEGLAFGRHDLH